MAQHDGRIKVTETGVANFRAFTDEQRDVNAEMRDFITESRARAGAETIFHNKRDQEIKDLLTRRDKRLMAWIAFATVMIAAVALGLSILVYLEGHRQFKNGELNIGSGENYAAHNQTQQLSGTQLPYHEGVTQ
jgi:hypothetical protein